MRKKFLLTMFSLVLFAFCGTSLHAQNAVAKVGNTGYATIDEAIASWTNGTTLTLLADVTLSDVVTLKSTEHHILNLGTYTMTAASGKNAIVIKACGNGSAEKGAITITADADEPGGINAGSKCVIYYKYADGGINTDDRPIIYIKGGVFTGSTFSLGTAGIYTIGKESRKCATLNISGGTFNCSINGSGKSKLLVFGGNFNYSVGSQGDSTALRLISGGRFKTLGFMTADSNNTKFWFGTSMAKSDVGLYVDKDGYLCVGGPVITETSKELPAVASNATKWSSYLAYSSAATYGLFYEDVDMAIKKHGEANVTIWVKPAVTIPETLTGTVVEEIKNNTALKDYTPENLPTGAELEIVLNSVGDKYVYDVTPMANGAEVEPTEAITFRLPVPASVTKQYAKVSHDGENMGVYEIQGEDNAKYVEIESADFSEFAIEPKDVVAKSYKANSEVVGVYIDFESAIDAAGENANISRIEVLGDYTQESVANTSDYYDVKQNLTIGASTGENYTVKGCGFAVRVQNAATLTIANNLTIEGLDVVANGFSTSGENMVIDGTIKALSLKQWTSNGTITVNGKVELGYGDGQFDMAYGNGNVIVTGNGNKTEAQFKAGYSGTRGNGGVLTLNDTYFEAGAWFNVAGRNTTINVNNSLLKVSGGDAAGSLTLDETNVINLNIGSTLQSGTISGNGKINIDAAGITEEKTIIKGNMSSFTGAINVTGNAKYEITSEGLVVKPAVAKIGDVLYTSLEEAFAAATEGQTVTLLADATPVLTSQRAITSAAVIDLNGKKLTLKEDDLYFGTTTFENGTIVVDPSVVASTAVFWMFENQILTFNNVDVVATGVTGTYLIGINGGTGTAVNLLNGSSITIDNETQANLTAVICDNGTGNNVTIKNSTINVKNIVGRFYLGGSNGNIAVENTTATLNGVKEGFYLRAGQTLAIAGTSNIDIILNETEGRYGINLTDITATYTKAETATVNASVHEIPAVAKIGETKYASLQAAINAVQNGETITLVSDVTENVTLTEKVDLRYTIDGAGKTMNGTITVNSLSDTEDNRRITVKNIKFVDTADANVDFISSVNTNHYPRLTIEGCTFTGSGNDGDVAVRLKSSHSVVIKGCTGTGLHSFLQNTSGWNLTIENVTVTDSKSGLALGTVQGVTVKGCNITAEGYGIRMDAQYNNNAVIESNTVKAFIPVVVRKASVESKITVNGTNTMTATNEDGLWCAIGTSEYEANGTMPSAATGKVSVTLNDAGLNADGIYGNSINFEGLGTEESPYLINNLNDLKFFRNNVDKQAQDGSTQYAGKYFKLTADIDLAGINWNPIGSKTGDHASFKGVFDGDNHTISNLYVEQAGEGLGLFAYTSGNAVIKNLKLNNVTVKSTNNSSYVGGVVGNAYASTKIENVHISGDVYISGRGYIGGIAGHGYVVMDNVSVVANEGSLITSTFWCAGGILGYAGEGSTNIKNANVEGITITSAAGCLGAIVGMAEDNNGTQPISGSNLSAKNVEIKTYVGAYGTSYANYALGYLYGGNETSILTGELSVENVNVITSTGEKAKVVDAVANVDGAIYFNITEAFAAAQEGDNVAILKAGTYALKVKDGLTITGDVDGVEFANIGAFGCNGANVTFNNVTFTYADNSTYKGLQHSGNLVYNKCTINGQVFLYGASETFNNCTFSNTGDNYNVWTYGAKEVAFNGCTFNCDGKSVLIYTEGKDTFNNVTVTECIFNASKAVEGKAAIEMDSSLSKGINLTIDGKTTATGFGTGNVSGNSLWNNKKGNNTDANNDITVKVNGETVLAPVAYAAKIGNVGYQTLAAAVNAAQAGETVKVFVAGTYAVPSMKAGITIEGVDGVILEGTLSGTLENLTLKNLHIKGANAQRWAYAKGNLLFENVTFEATSVYALHFDGITAGATLTYKDCTIIGWAAMSGSPASCTFDGCTFKGNGTYGLIRTYFDATITNCTFDVANVNTTDNYQEGIHAVNGATVTVNSCTNVNGNMNDVVNVSGTSMVVLDGKKIRNVAKIGGVSYTSLQAAIDAANDDDIITLSYVEANGPIEMNAALYGKNVTISGTATVDWSKGFLFVGRGGEGNATLTFDGANLTSASNSASYGIHVSGREKNTNNKYDGTVVIKNSIIDLDYLINKGAMTMDNSTLTVKNGFAIGGRPASETESGNDAKATIELTNGSKVVVNNHNGMGLGYEAIGVMNISSGSTFECTQDFLVTAKGTMNIAGTAKVAGTLTLTNNGAINFTADAAVLVTTNAELTIGYDINQDKKVVYRDGAYKVVDKVYVAQVGTQKFETLQDAINAVEDGKTITLIGNVTFTETTRTHNSGSWYDGLYYIGDKSFTIDLGGFTIGQDGSVNDYLLNFKNDGAKANTITLMNGTIDAGTAAYCALATASSNNNKITINTNNIDFFGNNSNGAVLKIRGGAELNANAGTIITGYNNYVGIEAAGTNTVVNINEGVKIYQNGRDSYVGSLVGVSGNGTVNVYGGEGTSAQGGFIAMTSGGTINVSGGEWIANTNGTYANGNKSVLIAQSENGAKSIVNVTGGTFKGGYNCYGDAVGDAQINISGGNYNAVPSAYVIKNFSAVQKGDNLWVVKQTSGELTRTLPQGWSWFSSYVKLSGADGFTTLTRELGTAGVQIKDEAGRKFAQYSVASNSWYGELKEASSTKMYSIKTSAAVEVNLAGDFYGVENYEPILRDGWNYLSYPHTETLEIALALQGFKPVEGDIIKSKSASAIYLDGSWYNAIELNPGEGYMYRSNAGNKQVSYTTEATRSAAKAYVSEAPKYWSVDATQYSSNMTMIATMDVDGADYEVAAFVNGELRGSARPIYVEAFDQYLVLMTINGDEVANVTFKYYDINAGEEYDFNNVAVYSNDAILGSATEPYALTRGTTGIGEATLSDINIYPNPTTTDREINLQATCDKVEVFNTLGVKVAEYQNVDSIDALETAGTYVIRVTLNGDVKHCRLVVK